MNETDIANVAAAMGDRSRAKVLLALAGGSALPASALAVEAGVSSSTISGHLTKLRDAKLLTVEHDGRHRFYRLATSDVADALEQLALIARPLPARGLREDTKAQALLRARLCYDHLAGRLGVSMMDALIDKRVLVAENPNEPRYRITDGGYRVLSDFGVDLDALSGRRPTVRYCVDWGERRHHLAGSLGAAIAARLFALRWIRRGKSPRVVHPTDAGRRGLVSTFGIRADNLG